jgi:hypothetical protein
VLLGKGRELFSVGCGCSEGGSIATLELLYWHRCWSGKVVECRCDKYVCNHGGSLEQLDMQGCPLNAFASQFCFL